MSAVNYSHIFATVLPPSVEDNPICGAVLPREWEGRGKPHCPACEQKRAELLQLGREQLAAAIRQLSQGRS